MAQAKNVKDEAAENETPEQEAPEEEAPEGETPEEEAPEGEASENEAPEEEQDHDPDQDDSGDGGQRSGGRQRKKVLTAKGAIRRSIEQLEELTGRTPESIIAVDRQEDGWKVTLELVESRRIPDTTDILAEYSATIDDRGELTGYRREARYTRGRVDG